MRPASRSTSRSSSRSWPRSPSVPSRASSGSRARPSAPADRVPAGDAHRSGGVVARVRRPPYPYAADILFTLPFLIDTLGNVFDLYDTIDWWDDANHFVNWGLLTAAFGQFLLRLRLGRAEHVRARGRLRGGHRGPVGVRRVLRVHPRFARAGHGLHGHAGRPRARPRRFDRGGTRHVGLRRRL